MNGQTVYLDVNYAMENGGGPITHLWLMDESGDNPDQTFVPEERAIAAEAERDRLLEYRERHDSLQRAKLAEIRDENAKLRELIKDMWRDIPKSEACAWDSSANTCIGSDSCIGECSYWYRMVKLGIEADDE